MSDPPLILSFDPQNSGQFTADGPPGIGHGGNYRFHPPNGGWSNPARLKRDDERFAVLDLQFDARQRGHALVQTVANEYAYVTAGVADEGQVWQQTQTITIPNDLRHPTLAFFYELTGGNAGNESNFVVNVTAEVTATTFAPATVFSATASSPRQLGWAALDAWAGQSITLTFAVNQAENEPVLHVQLDTITIGEWTTPRLDAIEPTTVDPQDGARLTISGENFVARSTVKLGDKKLTNVRLLAENTLQADVPAGFHPGLYDILITNPDGFSVLQQSAVAIGQQVYLPLIGR
jgi:hypothetical protein